MCLAGNRPFSLYYANANGSDNLLSEQYTSLANVHVHDKATQGVRLDIDALIKAAPADSDIFVCGPNGFINDVGMMMILIYHLVWEVWHLVVPKKIKFS